MSLRRATKIVATLGPASSDPHMLQQLVEAGVNVVRLNFSHGSAQDHIERARMVREAATRAGREVAIMADLQGPKIRVGKFAQGRVMLEPGANRSRQLPMLLKLERASVLVDEPTVRAAGTRAGVVLHALAPESFPAAIA